jgi:hypothetical protein
LALHQWSRDAEDPKQVGDWTRKLAEYCWSNRPAGWGWMMEQRLKGIGEGVGKTWLVRLKRYLIRIELGIEEKAIK